MLARALIVLLVVLNLGVAVWWATRGASVPTAPAAFASGVPKLRLLREMPGGVVPAPAPRAGAETVPDAAPSETDAAALGRDAAAATTASTVAPAATPAATPAPVAERCYAFGPFAADAAAAARQRLQAFATRVRERTIAAAASGSWRVMLPVPGDRAAAQAVATRIGAAGFNDYYLVAGGDGASTIALGLYSSEAAARQRESALRTAGFADVRAEAIGSAAPQVWLDAAMADPASPKALGGRVGATRVQSMDCATLR